MSTDKVYLIPLDVLTSNNNSLIEQEKMLLSDLQDQNKVIKNIEIVSTQLRKYFIS